MDNFLHQVEHGPPLARFFINKGEHHLLVFVGVAL
jgi:hypothetical protein